jgi:hypothetical protein
LPCALWAGTRSALSIVARHWGVVARLGGPRTQLPFSLEPIVECAAGQATAELVQLVRPAGVSSGDGEVMSYVSESGRFFIVYRLPPAWTMTARRQVRFLLKAVFRASRSPTSAEHWTDRGCTSVRWTSVKRPLLHVFQSRSFERKRSLALTSTEEGTAVFNDSMKTSSTPRTSPCRPP